MLRALLRIFVEEIFPHVEVCKKIPTHGTKCKTYLCSAGIILTNFYKYRTRIILTHVGTIHVGIVPTLYITCRNLSYKIRHCGNISC